ncbi:MAG: MBL fold metallo-hydrolase [Trueperaceae bacterium]
MKRVLTALLLVLSLAAAYALELHFIDVGQGDAVLIRSSSGQNTLYDGGRSAGRVLAYLRSAAVESLDLVIASHADADHIGGLIDVIEAYRPRYFMDNGIPHTTATYRRLLAAVAAAGTLYLEASGRTIAMGDVTLQVLPPPGDPALGQNDNSIGLIIEYGVFRAALTGDATPAQFEWWARHSPQLMAPVAVYKASHHGSRNGDTRSSVGAFRPEAVIISVGADNGYGHPAEEASLLYQSVAARVFRTDLQGSVLVHVEEAGGSYRVEADRGDPVPLTHLLALTTTTSLDEQADVSGTVVIECILFDPAGSDHDGTEVVTLRALETTDVSGWLLEDEANHSFSLPPVTLAAGDSLEIRNDGRAVWNNRGDTAFLSDATRSPVDSLTYSGSGSRACR